MIEWFPYVSLDQAKDRNFALKAIKKDPELIHKFVSLKSDENFIIDAIKANHRVFDALSEEKQKKPKIALAYIESNKLFRGFEIDSSLFKKDGFREQVFQVNPYYKASYLLPDMEEELSQPDPKIPDADLIIPKPSPKNPPPGHKNTQPELKIAPTTIIPDTDSSGNPLSELTKAVLLAQKLYNDWYHNIGNAKTPKTSQTIYNCASPGLSFFVFFTDFKLSWFRHGTKGFK